MIDLTPYIKNKKRHPYYEKSVENAFNMLIHFDGIPPGELLKKRRPAESETIHKYRMAIYECPTMGDCHKVENSLMKIRKSEDWMIKYEDELPSSIAEEESLEHYMEEYFPKYSSFTNWYFSVEFKTYLTDSNAFVLWKPLNLIYTDEAGNAVAKPDNVYYKPYPMRFDAHQVIDYVESEWYLLLSSASRAESRFSSAVAV